MIWKEWEYIRSSRNFPNESKLWEQVVSRGMNGELWGTVYKVPSLIFTISVFAEHSAQLCHMSIRSSSTTSSRG